MQILEYLWHRPQFLFLMIVMGSGVYSAWLVARLSRRLNPLFDPHFFHHLKWVGFIPSLPNSWLRASVYSGWVFNKRLFGRNQPHVEAYDFRSQVDAATYRMCRRQVVSGIFFASMCFIVGGALFIKKRI